MPILYLIIFLFSCFLLYWSGEILINHLIKLSKFLGLTEFVVAFFVMALAASLPNFFVGLTSVWQGVPELSLGDIFGNNMAALTLAIFFAVLFAPGREIKADGETVQISVWATALAVVLPLILLADNVISRSDGFILIIAFLIYVFWLLSKKERFSKIYDGEPEANKGPTIKKLFGVIKSLTLIFLGVALLLLAAQGIVSSAIYFAVFLGLPLILIGFLIVGFGNALPEVYFSFISARRGETSLILGNVMGSVIFPATLILGLVAVAEPIEVSNNDFLVLSRFFLLLASGLFLLAARTHKKISLNEAAALGLVYVLFMASIIWFFAL
ncbi:MAG: hypothetical protein WDZ85_03345 [Candidatus Paceibacterota bacterium]